ncbi:MAG TPA: hypothetical protein ENJ82_13450 [Bacteroidetes bacterium]|nr:hypothetical protein [Bacteroidota bacterium]
MKLLYLSKENLENSIFIKELVFNHKLDEKSLIIHDHFGSVADTRFVTKRISALMSEEMVVNNAFSGDQRNLLFLGEEGLQFREEMLHKAFATVQLFILNPIVASPQGIQTPEVLTVLKALREQLDFSEVILFPRNPLSPLAARREYIGEPEAVDPLIAVYDEEAELLEVARVLAPVSLAAPNNILPKKA